MMASMLDIKDWLLNKYKANFTTSKKAPNNLPGALTPDTIPDFVIPGSNEVPRRENHGVDNSDSEYSCFESRRSSTCSTKTNSGFSPSCSAVNLETRCASSAPGSPRHEIKDFVTNPKTSRSMNCIRDTNSDPLSVAAMSLPHFRSKTAFGFSTLSQKPHTRRKESLFHIQRSTLSCRDQGNNLFCQDSQCIKSLGVLSTRTRPDLMDDIMTFSDSDISMEKRTPSVIVTPSTSQIISPDRQTNHLLTTSRFFIKNGNVKHKNLKPNNLYYRRRSSLLGLNAEDSLTVSRDFHVKNSPLVQRTKAAVTRQRIEQNEKDMVALKRHSSPQLQESGLVESCEPHRSVSCSMINSSRSQNISEHGELKFAFQYLVTTKQLKLTLIKAENIGGSDKDLDLNPYAKVYLMPGKRQKQRSELFKHTQKPIFNQSFFFHGLSLKQLHAMTLRISIFHKNYNFRPPELMGKTDLELDNFDLLTENRMWRELDGEGVSEEGLEFGLGEI